VTATENLSIRTCPNTPKTQHDTCYNQKVLFAKKSSEIMVGTAEKQHDICKK